MSIFNKKTFTIKSLHSSTIILYFSCLQMLTVSTQTLLSSTPPPSSSTTQLTSLLMTTVTQAISGSDHQPKPPPVRKLLQLCSQLLPSLDSSLELPCVQFLYCLLVKTSKQEVSHYHCIIVGTCEHVGFSLSVAIR